MQTQEIKIEAGKRYVQRNGNVSEPVVKRNVSRSMTRYTFRSGHYDYTENGKSWPDDEQSPIDLMYEYVDAPELDESEPDYSQGEWQHVGVSGGVPLDAKVLHTDGGDIIYLVHGELFRNDGHMLRPKPAPAPEPLELWLNIYDDAWINTYGDVLESGSAVFAHSSEAAAAAKLCPNGKTRKFREVLE